MALTVLRTAAGSPVAPFVIRALKAISDVRVIAVDADPLSCGFAFADNHYVVPLVTADDFLDVLLDVCKRESVDVLFPDLDEELPLLADARERFQAMGTRVLVSEPSALERCRDKYRTFEFFRAHDIPTPETWLPEQLPRVSPLRFPLIVKPRRGRGSTDVFKVTNSEALERSLACVPNALVQQFIDGVEYTIDTLSDLEGRFLYGSIRQRLATDSGISVKGRTVVDPPLSALAGRIVEALPLVGPGCLQGLADADGIKFTEINPRIAGGVPLSIKAGAPLLSDVIRLVRGEPTVGPVEYRAGMLMLRFWDEVFV
jgi:carbamoyl-phosphate synthase large subunit